MRNEYLDAIREIAESAVKIQRGIDGCKSTILPELREEEDERLYDMMYAFLEKGAVLCEALQQYPDTKIMELTNKLNEGFSTLEDKLVEIGQIDDGTHPRMIKGMREILENLKI